MTNRTKTTSRAIAVLVLLFALVAGVGAGEPRRLVLGWDGADLLSPAEVVATEAAVVRIFALADVRAEWAKPGAETDAWAVLVAGRSESRGGALGVTPRDNPTKVCWIYLGRVRDMAPGADVDRAAEVLARVIAHEFVHVVNVRAPHSSSGLMVAVFTPESLTAPLMRADLYSVRHALKSLPLVASN